MTQLAIFMTVRTKPGKRDELRALWEKALKPRAQENNSQTHYVYAYDAQDKDIIRILEVYDNKDALHANAGADWFASYMQDAMPLLDGEPEFHMCDPKWIK